jgi:hypothetical protein
MKYYVKAIGQNRYAGGSCNWLLIRDIIKTKNGYDIKVRIKWGERFIMVSKDNITPNLIFKNDLNGWENFSSILKNYEKEN